MDKMIEYKVVMDKIPANLATKITDMLKEGWKPTGGICITQGPFKKEGEYIASEAFYHQAMIKFQVF